MVQAIGDERTYWTRKLSGDLPRSTFIYDYRFHSQRSRETTTITRILAPRISERIAWISNGSDLRSLTILISAIGLLLRKHSGNKDVLIGTTILKQKSKGPFINTLLPLRVEIDGETKFRDLLLDFHNDLKESLSNQNYPTRALAYDLSMEEDASNLFNVLVILENIQDPEYAAHITPDISFVFRIDSQSLSLDVTYSRLLYAPDTVERLLARLEILLEQVLFNTDINARETVLETEHDAKRSRAQSMTPLVTVPKQVSIAEVFDGIVAKFPTRLAVADESTTMSYEHLAERADILADRLVQTGIGANNVVGLIADRSVQLVVGILGILKSGAAYLPIDPAMPSLRTQRILAAAGAQTLVVTNNLFEQGVPHSLFSSTDHVPDMKPKLIVIEDKGCCFTAGDPGYRSTANDLAYVIFTSGSAGSPKGVLIEQRSVINLGSWLGDEVLGHATSPKRVGLIAPYTFDASVKQIFGALLNGHSLHITPQSARTDPHVLFNFLGDQAIDILDATPTHLRYWMPLIKGGKFPPSLQMLIIGGEAFPERLAAELFAECNSRLLIKNVYGPTECCDVTTCYEASANDTSVRTTVPIGKPIKNCVVEIADLDDHPASIGVVGEICIGGEGVGRGYVTAESGEVRELLGEPLGNGVAMYRSGDLGRWLPNGNLEFLGRKDQQIKFMGYRIEPQEIENAITSIEGVSAAVVVKHEDKNLNSFLFGYYAPLSAGDGQYVKRRLTKLLPAYMIPSILTPLPDLPVSANGKCDKSKLPQPAIDSMVDFAPPQGSFEQKLAAIWAKVLGVDVNLIGRFSSFLDLGGNSLVATLLLMEMQNTLGREIPLGQLFEKPTIAELSELLEEDSDELRTVEEGLILIKSGDAEDQNIFLVHDGFGQLESYVRLCNGFDSPFTVWGIRPEWRQRLSPCELSIETLANVYLDKILKVQERGMYFLGGWSLGGAICFEMARQLAEHHKKVGFVGLIDTATPQPSPSADEDAFTLESESRLIRELFPELDVQFKDCAEIEQLWSLTVELLSSTEIDAQEVLRRMMRDSGLPTAEQPRVQSIREVVSGMNLSRSLIHAQKTYHPTAVDCDLNVFLARDSKGKFNSDWGPLTKSQIKYHYVAGDHFSMMRPPHINELSRVFVEHAFHCHETKISSATWETPACQ